MVLGSRGEEHPASRQTRLPGLLADEEGRQPWRPRAVPLPGKSPSCEPCCPARRSRPWTVQAGTWVLVGANGAQSPAVGSLAYRPVPVAHPCLCSDPLGNDLLCGVLTSCSLPRPLMLAPLCWSLCVAKFILQTIGFYFVCQKMVSK